MPDNPHQSVLDTVGPIEWRKKLSQPIAILSDIANFGSNMILRVWPNTQKNSADVVLVMHLTRLAIMHVDGLRILFENGAGPTALLQLRALLETSLLMDWFVLSDSEEKAKYLMASNWRKQRSNASALIPGTQENTDFTAYITGASVSPQKSADAARLVSALSSQLTNADFGAINAAIDSLRGSGHEPEWYDVYVRQKRIAAGQPKGQKFSIRALAQEVNRLPEYRYLYSKMSNDAHGSALSASVELGANVTMYNVHRIHDFGWMLRTAWALTGSAYRLVLQRYRPNDDGLTIRYNSEWKPVLDRDWRVTETSTIQEI